MHELPVAQQVKELVSRLMAYAVADKGKEDVREKSISGRIARNARISRFFPLYPRARAIRRPIPRWESVFTIYFVPYYGREL